MAAREKDHAASSAGGLEPVVRFLRAGTTGQREIAGILCRGVMTNALSRVEDPAASDPLNQLILDYRNRVLAAHLLADQRPRIYLTYGAGHLPGVFALLRASDPKWHVASLKWLRTIDAPEEYNRSVSGLGVGAIPASRR